jgi:prepilin-type N-terminal cleavage/methylation domain-containing protein
MNPKQAAPAFTLIELLVVLTILAILTGLAVTSVEGVQDQSRYEATQRGLKNIEEALVGPANQRDSSGSPFVSGFVADMGRLPRAVDHDSDNATPLQPAELWINPYPAATFAIRPADTTNIPAADVALADAEVKVPCGWRGPYLRLAPGETSLRDGWGRPFELLKQTNVGNSRVLIASTDSNVEREIKIFRSLGADGILSAAATNDYLDDLYLNVATDAFPSPAYPVVSASNQYQAAFTVTVHESVLGTAPTAPVDLRLFGPNPETGLIKPVKESLSATGAPLVFTFDNSPLGTGTFTRITVGPKIVRAYMGAKKSAPLAIVVTQSGPTNFDLILKP